MMALFKFVGSVPLLVALSTLQVGMCARILGVFPITSVSHQIVYRAVMMELARRGHELVVITPDPVNNSSLANYKEIDVSFMYAEYNRVFNFAGIRAVDSSGYTILKAILEFGPRLCGMMFGNEATRRLISQNNDEHFDLVFVEWLMTPSLYGFAYRFSAPMIGFLSLPPPAYALDAVGNPTNPSYIPEIFLPYSDKMTFFERLDTLLFSLRIHYLYYHKAIPRHEVLVKRYFGDNLPSLIDMQYNVSMLFLNFEPSFHPPRPDVPAILHLAGLHLKPPKPLPEELQQYLDSAPKGVVYFSLGTNVRSDTLDAKVRRMFLDAFAELDGYHVLWKWESDSLPGQPANVKVQKWMPQQDILRHHKVKLFIMQGGLQSIEEAIHSGVPLISIPFFSDQDYNTKRIVEKGIGLKLDISEVSRESILQTMRTVLQEKSFRENVQRLSAIMRDQQTTPLERAVWWTEYVLRHKGAAHLRTAAVGMPWYQYLLLDVVTFLLAAVVVAIILTWSIAKFLYSRLMAFGRVKLKKN